MKAKSTSKAAKTREKQPYNDAKRPRQHTKKSQTSAELQNSKPVTSNSSPQATSASAPSARGLGSVLYRQSCLDILLEWYPDIKPRNDYDILELSSRHYKGTPAEIYAALDEEFACDVELDGYEFLLESCAQTLDRYIEPTGIKPRDTMDLKSKDVFIRPIPDSDFSLRLFPGSFSAAEYCLDFVETATGKPVNSPFEYELWGVPNPDADTPWLLIPMCGKLRSIEQSHGIKQADILPGEEKFVLRDGQTCVLVRPGKQSVRFTVPVRKMKSASAAVDDAHVVDLPQYIEYEES